MPLGEVADLGERRDVAVHGEHAVGGDQARAGVAGGLQEPLEVGHVGVRVALPLGPAEPDAVDDRGVVQRVGDDDVLLAEERLEQSAVRVEARGVEDGVLGGQEAGDGRLELGVDRCVPQMKRTLASPNPQRASPSWAAPISSGSLASPR